MGEGMASDGLPFPGTGCPIPDVGNLCLLCIDFYVWDAVSIFNHLPRMFLSTDFAFRITDWTCCHGPHLHAIIRIVSRGVSGLATDSPCGIWGCGWTTCLLHDSHFSAHISKWELLCKFGVIFHIFINSCLGSRFHAWNYWCFLLYNNLFIYQVLCKLTYSRRGLYSFLIVGVYCEDDLKGWLCFHGAALYCSSYHRWQSKGKLRLSTSQIHEMCTWLMWLYHRLCWIYGTICSDSLGVIHLPQGSRCP